MPEQSPRKSPCEDPSIAPRLISGSIGSVVTALALTPLEVVKVRQQAYRPSASTPALPPNISLCPKGCGTFIFNNGLMECVLPKSAVPYFDKWGQLNEKAKQAAKELSKNKQPGTFGMMRRIFVNEGLGGIYAGLAPTLVMSVPNTVLYFTVYDEIVARLRHKNQDTSFSNVWIPLVSGSSARLVASASTAPLELIRTRQASLVGQSQTAPGLMAEFRHIIQTEGAGALYQGLGPTLWRDVPFSAIYWMCLEQFKLLWKQHENSEPTPLKASGQAFVNGAAAGMIAAAMTAPFDVVKTRQQMLVNVTDQLSFPQEAVCGHNGAAVYDPPAVSKHSKGTLSVMNEIFDKEGIAGLWRGNQTRMIKIAPACAIMISCYELGKRIME